ncbi:MAG: DNA polymerase III subunit beta [bacterium]
MKFKINKTDFYQAIQNVIGVVPVKTTIPILGNVLLHLEENNLTLTGTDLEVSISTRMKVQGEVDGGVAIPAKVLFEIVRELPDIPMELECNEEDHKITITTEKGFYRLSGEAKEDFPKISIEESEEYFLIDSELLARMIDKTLFAVSTDELRTTLMGVYLQVMEKELRMVSTDGHRLVKIVDKKFNSAEFQKDMIIPTKALNLLLKNIQSNEKTKVNLSEDHVVFELGDTTILSKCIEGQFPNYERVIPLDNDKKVVINRELLSSSVRRVAIFSNSITHQIRFCISQDNVKIQSEDIEFGGEAEESIGAEYQGDDLEIGYNANYILDILRHLETDEVMFKVKDATSAGIVYPGNQREDEDLLMLLMPIRLNED